MHGSEIDQSEAFGTKYSRMDQKQFFKDCLPQILLGPFLSTSSHMHVSTTEFHKTKSKNLL